MVAILSMMPLETTNFDDLIEGAAQQGLVLTPERCRLLESLVHETAHALLLGVAVGFGMGPQIAERLAALEPKRRLDNELATLAVEVVVFQMWGMLGGEIPGFLVTTARRLAEAGGPSLVEEVLVDEVLAKSRLESTQIRAREVIRHLRLWTDSSLTTMGQTEAGRVHLERALERSGEQAVTPLVRAEAQLALARALRDEPEASEPQRRRARRLAEQARDTFREAGPAYAHRVDEVTKWISADKTELL